MRFRSLRQLTSIGTLAVLLALPATAGGRRPRPDDGTLSVRDGRGLVQITARGTIIGHVDFGQVQVVDRSPNDATEPVVRGGRLLERTDTTKTREGRNIRFRLTSGSYRLKVRGVGFDLAAVARGSVTLNGDERFADTGLYSLNGNEFLPVPYERTVLQLAAPPPAGG